MNSLEEMDREFADDPDYQQLSDEEKLRIIRVMEKMMDMGMAGIYGDESDNEADSDFPCGRFTHLCKAKCCTFIFALTKDEVREGKIQYNQDKPFFIARDKDGYCPHLDRQNWQCKVHDYRPLRCRRYDCRKDNILPAQLLGTL